MSLRRTPRRQSLFFPSEPRFNETKNSAEEDNNQDGNREAPERRKCIPSFNDATDDHAENSAQGDRIGAAAD
jgi:hypothetical protein